MCHPLSGVVLFLRFVLQLLMAGLHSSCRISQLAERTCKKSLTKYHDWGDNTYCKSWFDLWSADHILLILPSCVRDISWHRWFPSRGRFPRRRRRRPRPWLRGGDSGCWIASLFFRLENIIRLYEIIPSEMIFDFWALMALFRLYGLWKMSSLIWNFGNMVISALSIWSILAGQNRCPYIRNRVYLRRVWKGFLSNFSLGSLNDDWWGKHNPYASETKTYYSDVKVAPYLVYRIYWISIFRRSMINIVWWGSVLPHIKEAYHGSHHTAKNALLIMFALLTRKGHCVGKCICNLPGTSIVRPFCFAPRSTDLYQTHRTARCVQWTNEETTVVGALVSIILVQNGRKCRDTIYLAKYQNPKPNCLFSDSVTIFAILRGNSHITMGCKK